MKRVSKFYEGDLYTDRTQRFTGLLLNFIVHTSETCTIQWLSLYLQIDKTCV
jgi:hypothetical protein